VLLEKGANINSLEGPVGSTLHGAAAAGRLADVRQLLDMRIHVNAQGGHYGSALLVALERGNPNVMQLLVDRGRTLTLTVVTVSARCKLLRHKATFTSCTSSWTRVPTSIAQGGRYGSVLQADHGIDIDALGDCFGSALQAAATTGLRHD
jgi:hypothetical protein